MEATRKAFMRALRRALAWRLPPAEVRSVLTDYEGFFAVGAAEGKTEAELCRQFGQPRQVAAALLREEGWRGSRVGSLAFVWTALAALLNWWWTWRQFQYGDRLPVLYVLQLLLFPALWLIWRDTLTVRAAPSSRRWALVLWGVPAAILAAFYGYVSWLFREYLPWWQSLPAEEQAGGSSAGRILGAAYELAGTVLVLLVLAALLRCWWDGTPRYLPAAAWCVGVHAVLSQQYMVFTSMDVSAGSFSMELAKTLTLIVPLIPLGIVGLGGSLLTALLVWKGGRHGRAA